MISRKQVAVVLGALLAVAAMALAGGCAGLSARFDGVLAGHARTDARYLVVLGAASGEVRVASPGAPQLLVPLFVEPGKWLVVDLVTGERTTGALSDPLPPGAAAMFGPGEWDDLLSRNGLPPGYYSDLPAKQ